MAFTTVFTLEAARILPRAEGGIAADCVVVAHLRMPMTATLLLKAAIDNALLPATPAVGGNTKN